jgi:hypothetical protein
MTVVATVLKRTRERVEPLDSRTESGLHVRTAGAAILGACYRDEIVDYFGEKIALAEGVHADDFLEQVASRLDMRFGSSLNEPMLSLLQILCTQGALQGMHAFSLFRTLYLLELEDFVESSRSSPYDGLFQSAYGCAAAEFVALLQGMWSVAAISGEFIAATFIRESPIADRLAPVAAVILREHSCRIQRVKSVIDDELGHHGLDGLVAAFFSRYPFVEFRPGVYFPGPHPYLRLFSVAGPLFRTLELGRKHAGKLESPESLRMGRRFEALVQLLLSEHFTDDQLVDEHPLDTKGARRSPDHILFETSGVTLIQSKIKRLSPASFFGFTLDALKADADKAIAELVSKSIKYLTWLESAEAQRSLTDEARATRDRITSAKKIFLLGVVPAMPSVFHVTAFRTLVWDGVLSRLRADEKAWWERNRHRVAGWHVIDSEELVEFLGWRKDWGLNEALTEYVALPEFGRFAIGDKYTTPFSGYVAARGRRLGHRLSFPKVDVAIRRFLDWTVQFVFQKSLAEFEALDAQTVR